MCYIDISPRKMVCGHSGPDSIAPVRSCNKNPCETNGIPKYNWLGSTRMRALAKTASPTESGFSWKAPEICGRSVNR